MIWFTSGRSDKRATKNSTEQLTCAEIPVLNNKYSEKFSADQLWNGADKNWKILTLWNSTVEF